MQNLKSEYVLIEDFYGGDFDDYYSQQIYYDSKITVKHRNLKRFIFKLINHGYKLLYQRPYMGPIRGAYGLLPMSNLPKNIS